MIKARRQSILLRLVVAAGVMVLATGCTSTRSYEPKVDPNTLTDMQFIHYLQTVPVVTVGESCRAMLVAADGEDRLGSDDERYGEMMSRGSVRESWNLTPVNTLDYGTLAYMAASVCELPPTVDTALFGSWGLGDRRYAVKQAVRWDLMEYAPTYKAVSGGELVNTLARIDRYMAQHDRYEFDTSVPDAPDEATRAPQGEN